MDLVGCTTTCTANERVLYELFSINHLKRHVLLHLCNHGGSASCDKPKLWIRFKRFDWNLGCAFLENLWEVLACVSKPGEPVGRE